MGVHIEQAGDREAPVPVQGNGPSRERLAFLETDPSDAAILDQHGSL